MIALLFATLLQAADCEIAFPIRQGGKVVEACVEVEKIYSIGHIRFFSFPKSRLAEDIWPYDYTYFASTSETRNRLCRLLGTKSESRKSHIEDATTPSIEYSRSGFSPQSKTKALKVLACRLI